MKEFAIYSLLRLLLLVAVFVVVLGIWIKVLGSEWSIIWPLLVAFVISGVLSAFLLNRPREALAQQVEQRAHRASAKFQEMKTREDLEGPDPAGPAEPSPGSSESGGGQS